MKKNIGKIDRAIRMVIATLMVAIGLYTHTYILVWLAAIPLVTAFVGICPLYSLLHKSTCHVEDGECN